ASCRRVTSQTAANFLLTTVDEADTIRVAVAALDSSNGDAAAPVLSAPTTVVPAVPVNTAAPTVSGTAQQGSTLTEVHGSWSGSPIGFTYQWLRCSTANGCSAVTGATAQTYALTVADVGFTMQVSETAS